MKTIIAGSRNFTSRTLVRDAVEAARQFKGIEVSIVVSGTCRGIDQSGEAWAKENSIPIIRFPAEWKRFGKSAGYMRNIEMAEYADALIAIWDGQSQGTKHMIDVARYKGLTVFVFLLNKPTPVWERKNVTERSYTEEVGDYVG